MRFISGSAFVALVAVFVMGAVGVASASAAECPGTGSGVALCVEGKQQRGTETAFTGGSSGEAGMRLESAWGDVACPTVSSKGTFNTLGASLEATHVTVEATNCVFTSKAGCTVSPIVFEGNGHQLKGVFGENPEKMTLEPTQEETLAKVTIKECGLDNQLKTPLTGKLTCKFHEGALEAVTHKVSCAGEGHVFFNGRAATLEFGQTLELSGQANKKWSIQRN